MQERVNLVISDFPKPLPAVVSKGSFLAPSLSRRVGYPSPRSLRHFRYLPTGHLLNRIRRRDVACYVSAAAGKIQRLFSTFPFRCNPPQVGKPLFLLSGNALC
jgi:hypothetical protein